ncbi:MAG: response regulator transcription factor [Mucilaginibacter sp.]
MKKILVIDNDPDALVILGFIFEDKNRFNLAKYAGKIPVDEIISEQPDLIILDHYLDEGLGSEICLELKNNPVTKSIPVIMLSTASRLKKIAADSCADAYVTKPFDLSELEGLVDQLLN